MPMSTKCQKMTINVIQHDDRLFIIFIFIRIFYNGASSIASKNDLDDQNLLLATVYNRDIITNSSFTL
jgi:hypothetical protein